MYPRVAQWLSLCHHFLSAIESHNQFQRDLQRNEMNPHFQFSIAHDSTLGVDMITTEFDAKSHFKFEATSFPSTLNRHLFRKISARLFLNQDFTCFMISVDDIVFVKMGHSIGNVSRC
eukprot:TRINITY_DN2089_c0_g1_i1.p1 TRINITY_DN2089_c0_g1~~TRINITY_DN2089_c0_g1_i1.p1  ORF type:complete len:118 (-),score=6.15 TRINITY_DN2089_c0_g1_i1:247-600(-)